MEVQAAQGESSQQAPSVSNTTMQTLPRIKKPLRVQKVATLLSDSVKLVPAQKTDEKNETLDPVQQGMDFTIQLKYNASCDGMMYVFLLCTDTETACEPALSTSR